MKSVTELKNNTQKYNPRMLLHVRRVEHGHGQLLYKAIEEVKGLYKSISYAISSVEYSFKKAKSPVNHFKSETTSHIIIYLKSQSSPRRICIEAAKYTFLNNIL